MSSGRNPTRMEDAILECGGADPGVVSRTQTGELTQERSMTVGSIAIRASSRCKKTKQRFLASGCNNHQHVVHGLDCIPWLCSHVHITPGNDRLLKTTRQKKTQRQDIKNPMEKDQMDVDPESRRRMRGKTRLIGLEQPSAPTANTGPDTSQQETK